MAVKCPRCGKGYDITLFEYGHTVPCDCGAVVDPFGAAALDLPVEGELDLHTFRPAEVKDLLSKRCLKSSRFVWPARGKAAGAQRSSI